MNRVSGEADGRLMAGNLRSGCHRAAALGLVLIALASGLPLNAQTALAMSNPGMLSKTLNSKTEIERCIILATPNSLDRAKDGLAQSKVISDDDKKALSEISRGISVLLYPRGPNVSAKGAKTGGNGNDAAQRF